MAETLTYDSTPADAPELNADEQESLAIGEEMQSQQEQLLAGKYKNAQELESAYMELQKKLGGKTDEEENVRVEESQNEEPSTVSFLNDASSEYSEKGELSEETMSKLTEMSSEELVQAYIESQANSQSSEPATLSEKQVNSIKGTVGGEESYERIVSWAGENLDNESIESFDALIETGNAKAIEMAVAGLKSMYEAENGVEGKMVTGKAPRTDGEKFKSQAEVVAAMADPRYDRDPAYRDEIVNKLERSNINF
jgi:hypothetical protein